MLKNSLRYIAVDIWEWTFGNEKNYKKILRNHEITFYLIGKEFYESDWDRFGIDLNGITVRDNIGWNLKNV